MCNWNSWGVHNDTPPSFSLSFSLSPLWRIVCWSSHQADRWWNRAQSPGEIQCTTATQHTDRWIDTQILSTPSILTNYSRQWTQFTRFRAPCKSITDACWTPREKCCHCVPSYKHMPALLAWTNLICRSIRFCVSARLSMIVVISIVQLSTHLSSDSIITDLPNWISFPLSEITHSFSVLQESCE